MKGTFITLEGGEGAGKSTLMTLLQERLTALGKQVVTTREPGGCALAEQVRNLLLDRKFSVGARAETLLFLAARSQHIEEIIAPALAKDKIVICDRFNDSTIAYQGHARGLGIDHIEALCHWVCGSLSPQITLLLDLDPQMGLARRKKVSLHLDRLEAQDALFHERVREGFLLLAKRYPQRIVLLDARKGKEELVELAMQAIRESGEFGIE